MEEKIPQCLRASCEADDEEEVCDVLGGVPARVRSGAESEGCREESEFDG